ncbi:MAG: hypothetical protein ACC683_10915 [Acidimicrobiia bacterium]
MAVIAVSTAAAGVARIGFHFVVGVVVLFVAVILVSVAVVVGATLTDLALMLPACAHLRHGLCTVQTGLVGVGIVHERLAASGGAERNVVVPRRTQRGVVDGHATNGIEKLGHVGCPP